MEQDIENVSVTSTEERQATAPPRIRRPKPKVNLVQRNKPNLPVSRKQKPNQSKNLNTQTSAEPPPDSPLKTGTTMIPMKSTANPDPSFFENSEISPHRKKVVSIDLTDPEDHSSTQTSQDHPTSSENQSYRPIELPPSPPPLVLLQNQQNLVTLPQPSKKERSKQKEKKITPKRKKQAANQSSITNYFSPPEPKKKPRKNSYDSEEELPGFDCNFQNNQSYNFVIIENPQPDATHNSEDEIPETFDLSSPIPNLRTTEPTPPPLGNISSKKKTEKPKKVSKKKAASTPKLPSPTKVKTPGKQRITKTIHPYLLLVKDRKELNDLPDEFTPVDEVDCKTGTVQCGYCGEVVFTNEWLSHLETHYGVGWKVGEPIEVSL